MISVNYHAKNAQHQQHIVKAAWLVSTCTIINALMYVQMVHMQYHLVQFPNVLHASGHVSSARIVRAVHYVVHRMPLTDLHAFLAVVSQTSSMPKTNAKHVPKSVRHAISQDVYNVKTLHNIYWVKVVQQVVHQSLGS